MCQLFPFHKVLKINNFFIVFEKMFINFIFVCCGKWVGRIGCWMEEGMRTKMSQYFNKNNVLLFFEKGRYILFKQWGLTLVFSSCSEQFKCTRTVTWTSSGLNPPRGEKNNLHNSKISVTCSTILIRAERSNEYIFYYMPVRTCMTQIL